MSTYDPDFVERNGTWILSVLAVVTSCFAGMLAYFLKSRCTTIKCCGTECTRDVLDLTTVSEDQLTIEMGRRFSARVPPFQPAA